MRITGLTTALFLLLSSVIAMRADVAPDKGYTRVQIRMILEATEDLAEYRFFVVSSDLVKEIFVRKGEKTTVGPLGGGARYSSGTIVAIPRVSLREFGENPTGDKLAEMESTVASYGVPGTIKLLTQGFSREVPDAYAGDVTTTYRIEKTPGGLMAMAVEDPNTTKSDISLSITDVPTQASFLTLAMIAGGILMSLAFVTIGLWLFMRFIRKGA